MMRNLHCCYRCAEPFETQVPEHSLCGHCLSNNPAFASTVAPFVYQGPMRYLIQRLKFNAQYKSARLLGTLLAQQASQAAKLPELIIPVPLHRARYRQRGFNQAIEIAKTVAIHTCVPVDLTSCIRHRNTPHQIDLPAKQRRKNLKNAFAIEKSISAQHVAIIDDVMTTGTTVSELAKVLHKTGVKRIDIWVCARA